jgi:hypothetical protein
MSATVEHTGNGHDVHDGYCYGCQVWTEPEPERASRYASARKAEELARERRRAAEAEEEFAYARDELTLARERLAELRARVSDAESWVRVSERALARATSEFYRTQAPAACVNGYHVPEPHAWIRTCAEGPAAR